MKLNQLICKAASVYPDGFVLEYWDMGKECPRENPEGGDTLAQFIARELADTYDSKADDRMQVETAVRAMESAAENIKDVAIALEDVMDELSPDARPWICPECGFSMRRTYESLAGNGGPICPKCDCDMKLEEQSCVKKS